MPETTRILERADDGNEITLKNKFSILEIYLQCDFY